MTVVNREEQVNRRGHDRSGWAAGSHLRPGVRRSHRGKSSCFNTRTAVRTTNRIRSGRWGRRTVAPGAGKVARTLAEGGGAALSHVPRPPLRRCGERRGEGVAGDRGGGCGGGSGVRRELRLRRRPHPAARSRTKRQNPLPPLRLQRILPEVALVTQTGPRHEAAQKTAGRSHGWPGVYEERQDAAANQRKSPPGPGWPGGRKVSGGDRIRTCDLEVMSLASYRAAPPRDMFCCVSASKRPMPFPSGLRDVAPSRQSE